MMPPGRETVVAAMRPRMPLMRRIVKRNLNGPRGLVAAVIAQAVHDWRSGKRKRRKNARRYFKGPVYRYHLGLLDLPKDWLPVGVETELQP